MSHTWRGDIRAARRRALPSRREVSRLRSAGGTLGLARGRLAEERLLAVLMAGPRPRWVTNVLRATPEEDERGVDLLVCAGRRRYPIQVKCSVREALLFVPAHAEGIGVVVAPPELDDATALGRVLGVLILLREGRCSREAMRSVLEAQAGDGRGGSIGFRWRGIGF